MKIHIEHDRRDTKRAYTATCHIFKSFSMYRIDSNLTAYGATEKEARENMLIVVKELEIDLNDLKKPKK